MGILEIVFNSRKFDLNDDVLMGFDNYFDKKSKDYNSFCLDVYKRQFQTQEWIQFFPFALLRVFLSSVFVCCPCRAG